MCTPLVVKTLGDHITMSVPSLKLQPRSHVRPVRSQWRAGSMAGPRARASYALLPAGSPQVWTRPQPHVHCTNARKGFNCRGAHLVVAYLQERGMAKGLMCVSRWFSRGYTISYSMAESTAEVKFYSRLDADIK